MAVSRAAAPDQMNESKRKPLVLAVASIYATIGVLWLVHLAWTFTDYPLTEASAESASWSGAWALLAISNYYAGALGICGVILMTEQLLHALLWCALIMVLGSPMVCIYFFQVFRWYGGFSLRGRDVYQRASGTSAPNLEGTLGIGYVVLGFAIIIRFIWNQVTHSLITFDTEDASWAFEWFISSWANFYVLVLCFDGMILCSQAAQTSSAWCVATLIVGSPACCAFLAFRLWKYGTCALGLNTNEKPIQRPPHKASFESAYSDRTGGDDVVRVGSKDNMVGRTVSSGSSPAHNASERRVLGKPNPRSSTGEADFGEKLSARSGGHDFAEKGSTRAASKDFGQTWSQRSSRRGSMESAGGPRVLVQATTPMSRSGSKEFGEANSARPIRAGSKDFSGNSGVPASRRANTNGTAATSQGYEAEEDERMDAI